ncbi:MAG: nucleoside deaminase [Myxococcales bacterium]|nr:nucleoside deaminase [Myxococcales bacterium]
MDSDQRGEIVDPTQLLQRSVDLAREKMLAGEGGPFGAVIARQGEIIAEGWNRVTSANDPTAHAEIMAIRLACEKLGSFSLAGCEIYASCEPCPMCLAAIYWARLERVTFAATREQAARVGFDDARLYRELRLPLELREVAMAHLSLPAADAVFELWENKTDKIPY